MAAQSLLAKLGMRSATLGAAASLAIAAPLAEGDPSMAAHTDATRIGWYFDRTGGSEKIGHVVMGTDSFSIGAATVSSLVPFSSPASTVGSAGLNIGQGVAPAAPVNGEVWITAAGMFSRAGGVTYGPFDSSGGTVTSVGVTSTDLSVSGSPVTTSGNITLNINSGVVTLAKMANLAANSIIGNNTGVSATPLALTGTQVTAMLDNFTSVLPGLAPASGGGTTNFLRADATWAPAGTGTVTSVGVSSTDLSVSGSPITTSGSITLNINAGAVTLAKMANLAANSIIGNNTGGATTPLALTGTQVTAMLDNFTAALKGLVPLSGGGTTNFLRADGTWSPAGTGTVTSVGVSSTDLSVSGSPVTTSGNITLDINAGVVTLAKMANLAANSIIGNNTGGAATPLALTGTQVTAMLDNFTSALKGLVPLSGGGTTNFLRADGTWAVVGTGTVTSVGITSTDLSVSGSPVTTSGNITLNVSAGAITLAKMANLAANSIIGNNTGGATTPLALTGTQVTAMLDNFTSALKGLVPLSGGGTTNFLRADGTWAPAGTGTIGGTIAVDQVAFGSGADTIQGSATFTFTAASGLVVNLASSGVDNLTIGSTAGNSLSSGGRNTLLGTNAGTALTSSDNEVAVGYNALADCTVAENTAVGSRASEVLSSSLRTVSVGFSALGSGVAGVSDSTAVGHTALLFATGLSNTAVGSASGDAITTGARNSSLGHNALGAAATNDNVAVGYQALLLCTVAENTAIGSGASDALTTALRTVSVGFNALGAGITGVSDSTAIGHTALVLATGLRNTAVGSAAGAITTTGTDNIFLGAAAGDSTANSASNRCIIGSNTSSITTVFIGKGETSTAPAAVTLNATGASGTNIAGTSLTLAGSRGTGTGAGGALIFQTAPAGGSGASANALITRMSIIQDGGVDWTGITTANSPAVSVASHGTIFYDSTLQKFRVSQNTGAYVDLISGGTIGGTIAINQVAFGSGADTIQGSATFTYNATAGLALAPTAVATGTQVAMTVTGAANTNQTASTEAIDVNFNLARTVQFATGALTTQRAHVISAPTYAFVGASVITTAATLAITGAPAAGANATLTNTHALLIQAGSLAAPLGTAALPTYTFGGDSNTGMYSAGADQVNWATGGTLRLSLSTSSITSTLVNLGPAGTAGAPTYSFSGDPNTGFYNSAADTIAFSVAGSNAFTLRAVSTQANGSLNVNPPDVTSGAACALRVNPGNDTGQTASTEASSIIFDLTSTKQWATGAITTQRDFRIAAPTYTFVGASTITNSATFAISGAPIAGTNATLTNTYAMWVQSGMCQFDSNIRVDGAQVSSTLAQLEIAPTTVATSGTPSLLRVTGAANTTMTASTEVSDAIFNFNRTIQWSTGAITTQRAFRIEAPTYAFVGASTVTTAATVAITGSPTAGANATLTNTYALWVQSGTSEFDGRINTIATTTSEAGINIPHGTAPTSPVNGDFWSEATGFYGRVSGTTVGPFSSAGGGTIGGTIAATQVAFGTGLNVIAGEANFTWDSTTDVLTLVGAGTPTALTGLKLQTADSIDAFIQNNIQNKSVGSTASSDWVATSDTGTDTTNFVDMGVNGSGWASGTWTINGANDCYLYAGSTDLAVGTAAAGQVLALFSGGTLAANIRMTFTDALIAVTPGARLSGSATAYTYTGASGETPAASVEAIDVNYALNRTVTFATGALATQRAYVIAAPTYAFVGASTLTTAATLCITDAPVAGTNATITNRHALLIQAGSLAAPLGTAALPTYTFGGDANTGVYSTAADAVGITTGGTLRVTVDTTALTCTNPYRGSSGTAAAPGLSFSADTNIGMYRVGADDIGFAVNGVLTMGLRTTSTQTSANFNLSPVLVSSGAACAFRLVTPADTAQTASTEASSFIIDLASTRQFATGALTTQRAVRIAAPTYGFVAASTITNAATFAVSGAPIAGTNATLTNSYAVWVQAGASQFDGNVRSNSSILSTSQTAGVGYATGAGGTVTQVTNKATGVTLNRVCGQITLNNASLAATTAVGFTFTNSAIAATDVVSVTVASAATADSYSILVDATAAGSCRISLRNNTGGALAEALVLNFAVLKSVAA